MAVALAIIEVEEEKIVTVSRKTDDTNFGLPGGKIENGETPYEAMVREVKEETGLVVKNAFLLDKRDYDGHETYCFYVTELEESVDKCQAFINFNENNPNEGKVSIRNCFVTYDDSSSYKDYNLEIFELRDIYMFSNPFYLAFKSVDLKDFMTHIFPLNWKGVVARIIETGVKFSTDPNEPWLIGVSDIQKTKKTGTTYIESLIKSVLFTSHDCFHQLWGLPYIENFDDKDFNFFKKAQMCGEIAVLTITEFILAKQLKKRCSELANLIDKRCSTAMMNYGEPLYHLSPVQLAVRLDELLHKKITPDWIVGNKWGEEFLEHYVPMLQRDRDNIDNNWEIMKKHKFIPNAMPNVRYSGQMTGLELTQWMIQDFMHIRNSDENIDYELAEFNSNRRKRYKIPTEWVY